MVFHDVAGSLIFNYQSDDLEGILEGIVSYPVSIGTDSVIRNRSEKV